jgi:TonB family protein
MKMRSSVGLWVALALAMYSVAIPGPTSAVQAQQDLSADRCVSYGEDGKGGYHLTNTCDYSINVAFCTQPNTDPSLCLRTQSWSREQLNAKAAGKSQIFPDHALDLFACRSPGAVEILSSGMARCTSAPAEPVIPIMSTAALKNPAAIITDRDYPPSEHDKEGTTRFELMVGPDGKPTSCNTTVSSGFEILDQTACNAFLKRARFSPAKDASGNPTAGRYKGSVTWKAP